MHRQMQARVDRPVTEIDLPVDSLKRLGELGMLVAAYIGPHIRIAQLTDADPKLLEDRRISNEGPPVLVGLPA